MRSPLDILHGLFIYKDGEIKKPESYDEYAKGTRTIKDSFPPFGKVQITTKIRAPITDRYDDDACLVTTEIRLLFDPEKLEEAKQFHDAAEKFMRDYFNDKRLGIR